MYARSTTFTADPQRIDEGIRILRDETMPTLQDMPGSLGLSLLCDRGSGRCIITASWESHEAMAAARERVRDMRERAVGALGGRDMTVDEWEIAAMHRAHALGEGAWARVTYGSLRDAGRVDQFIDSWKSTILPRLDGVDGFSSASLMVDRTQGRVVGTGTFDSREALDRSREMVTRMREEFSSRMEVDITDVLEMEVALHHLRVPEMV